jgi:hypothetical protein
MEWSKLFNYPPIESCIILKAHITLFLVIRRQEKGDNTFDVWRPARMENQNLVIETYLVGTYFIYMRDLVNPLD